MNSAVQNTIQQYFSIFIENISSQYNIPIDELETIWKDTQKVKVQKSKRRRVKNPNKAPSAYIAFCAQNRLKIKEDNPEATFGEISKLLGQNWKNLSIEEKDSYKQTPVADTEVVIDSTENIEQENEDEAADETTIPPPTKQKRPKTKKV